MDTKSGLTSIEEYISTFPFEIQTILQDVKKAIKEVAPQATEAISYQMPTFKLNGKNIVHFAAWKNHLGFYPTPSGTEKFDKELTPYKRAKGSIIFPFDQPMPLDLIKQITEFRAHEVLKST